MTSKLPDPDKIPDMSLDRPADPPAGQFAAGPLSNYANKLLKPTPEQTAPQPDWQEGDRVFAPWEPRFMFAGVIKQIRIDDDRGDQARIEFDDGREGWVNVSALFPLAVQVGQLVESRRYQGDYKSGQILEVSGSEVNILYDDGGTGWAPIASLCVPCAANGPGARPVVPAVLEAPMDDNSEGSGIPSWVIWIGISVILAFIRIGCREMARN